MMYQHHLTGAVKPALTQDLERPVVLASLRAKPGFQSQALFNLVTGAHARLLLRPRPEGDPDHRRPAAAGPGLLDLGLVHAGQSPNQNKRRESVT